jgi:hypothetical protein
MHDDATLGASDAAPAPPPSPLDDADAARADALARGLASAGAPSVLVEVLGTPPTDGVPATTVDEDRDEAPTGTGPRFDQLAKLGEGGQAQVYRASDRHLSRTVALKVAGRPADHAQFLREGRSIARLEHPNVVTIHDVCEAATERGPLFVLVMKHYPAGSLRDWLARRTDERPLPPRWAAALIAAAADGVQHAHERGIVHRDIKPGDILLDASDTGAAAPARESWPPPFVPVVSDFGLAREATPGEAGAAGVGTVVGTLAYMPPEQARGEAAVPATDVYALGAVLYELLTGRRVFETHDRAELLAKIAREEPTRPRALRPELHPDLETICLKCLEKDPRDRYPTPAALAANLRMYLTGEPIPGGARVRVRRALRWVRRHTTPLAWAAMLPVLAALALGTSLQLRAWKQQGLIERLKEASPAELPRIVAALDLGLDWVRREIEALLPTGQQPAARNAAIALPVPDLALDILLDADPTEIGPYTRALQGRLPDLPARLRRAVTDAGLPAAGPAESAKARLDRRRATAATALAMLGLGGEIRPLLVFRPDPQPRSFLIHGLGPAGVPPATVLDLLAAEPDPTARFALILALGEVPAGAWADADRRRAAQYVARAYAEDPSASVHAASRWLLLRWRRSPTSPVGRALAEALRDRLAGLGVARPPGDDATPLAARLDDALAGLGPRTGFGWRIGPLGVTLVRVELPRPGARRHVLEISDCEITVAQYHALLAEPAHHPVLSPSGDCPMNRAAWADAARFCNRLSARDHIPPERWCYVEDGADVTACPDHRRRPGYRLLTLDEFAAACRAGSTTPNYFGNAPDLLRYYAWHRENLPDVKVAQPVAGRKPNDFGLFDTLGNLAEWCELPDDADHGAIVGYGCYNAGALIHADTLEIDAARNDKRYATPFWGFRVARTIAEY